MIVQYQQLKLYFWRYFFCIPSCISFIFVCLFQAIFISFFVFQSFFAILIVLLYFTFFFFWVWSTFSCLAIVSGALVVTIINFDFFHNNGYLLFSLKLTFLILLTALPLVIPQNWIIQSFIQKLIDFCVTSWQLSHMYGWNIKFCLGNSNDKGIIHTSYQFCWYLSLRWSQFYDTAAYTSTQLTCIDTHACE